MTGTALEGTKFVARTKKGAPTTTMGLRSRKTDTREAQRLVNEATTKSGSKRRLTALERTALEGAKYLVREPPTKKQKTK